MRFISRDSRYGRNVYIVALDEQDYNRSDKDMISCADNGFKYGRQACHFGGSVEPLPDDTVRITVYID